MSLEVACTNGQYAVIVSDSLVWNDRGTVREDGRKQIELGNDIVVAAGGFSSEIEELFLACQRSYEDAVKYKWVPLDEVLDEFIGNIREKPFPGFDLTCLCGLLAARRDDGFLLVRQRANFDHQERLVKPGDDPGFAYCTPTGRVEALCCCFINQAVVEPMTRGADPERIIANLRDLYHAAASIESPPKLNENLRIAILGDVKTGPPCEPDPALESALVDFVGKVRALDGKLGGGFQIPTTGHDVAEVSGGTSESRADNAINNAGEYSHDAAVTIGAAETDLGSVTISSNGGDIAVHAKLSAVNTGTATTLTLRLRKDSATGTILDQCFLYVTVSQPGSISLMAIDTSPAASQSYHVTGLNGSANVSCEFLRIIATNRKK